MPTNPIPEEEEEDTCSFCGDSVLSTSLSDGLCPTCQENTFICDRCGSRDSLDNSFSTEYDGTVCVDCYEDRYFTCEDCGRVLRNRDHAADGYCTDCHHDDEEDLDADEVHTTRPVTYESTPIHGNSVPGFPSHILIGYELEHFFPRSKDPRPSLAPHGLCKGDGSIRPDPNFVACEFASRPASGDALLSNIDAVFRILASHNARVNSSCGLHIHVSMADFAAAARDNILKWWRIYEPIFFDMMAPERRTNHYCQQVSGTAIESLRADRYHALNVRALTSHATYELRLHHATLDPAEVKNFIRLVIAFFRFAAQTEVTPEHLADFQEMDEPTFFRTFLKNVDTPYSCNKSILTRLRRYSDNIWRKK